MTAKPQSALLSPLQTARQLAAEFALTAVERDERGGTPKAERDALRHSGLLALSIPVQYGGLGASWSDTLGIVREFAKVDSSIAHVFGFHHLMLATVRLFARPEQWQPWFEQTARKNWFWGNALNPLDTRTVVKNLGGWREFSGKKSFCSGASDSEMLIASAVDESAGGKLLIAAIPSGRSGITLHNDWNNMGQRQTDSGSATFERVRVEESELLLDPGPLSTPFACLRPLIAQLTFTHLFLGIAEGAFEEARQYTLTEPGRGTNPVRRMCVRILMCSAITVNSGSPSKAFGCWWNAPPNCSTRRGPKARISAPKNADSSPPPSLRRKSPPHAMAWTSVADCSRSPARARPMPRCDWIVTGATCARKPCTTRWITNSMNWATGR